MFNVGIIGTGSIAEKMATAIKELRDVKVTAVASRKMERAKAFIKANCPKATPYGSYEEFAMAPDIDLVYIATPNTYHYENAIRCIKEYKNVLVEKPFTMSRAEADSIFVEAKNRGIFVCEAMWTAFMPLHKKMLEWIRDGRIGAVRYVSSNLGYNIEDKKRLTDPALGGGAYLDLGVYPAHLAMSIMGDDLEVKSVYARKLSTDIDRETSFILGPNGDGPVAMAYVTMIALTDRDGSVVGEKGYIKLFNINDYEKIELYNERGELLETAEREGKSGYALEMQRCKECIADGLIQCPEMPWSRTATLATLNDKIRSMM